jgi:hypothetical protein
MGPEAVESVNAGSAVVDLGASKGKSILLKLTWALNVMSNMRFITSKPQLVR